MWKLEQVESTNGVTMEPNGELSETIYASVSEASPKTLAQRKFTLFKESE
jgi:hypothetical protein